MTGLEIYTSFPVAEFVVAIGFFIIVIAEQIALDFKERSGDTSGHSHGQFLDEPIDSDDNESTSSRPLLDPPMNNSVNHHDSSQPNVAVITPNNKRLGSYGSFSASQSSRRTHKDSVDLFRDQSREETLEESHDVHSHSITTSACSPSWLYHYTPYSKVLQLDYKVLLIKSWTSSPLSSFIKPFLLQLGMTFVQSKLSRRAIIQACVCFAIMAPIGIATGIIVDQKFSDFTHSVFNGLLQGLATGTFLYITFF